MYTSVDEALYVISGSLLTQLGEDSVGGRADGQYRPFEAHRAAALRRRRHRPTKLATSPQLLAFVAERLTWRWSPQQISRDLHLHFPARPDLQLCSESIYQAIYRADSTLLRPSVVIAPARSPLRTGRDHRRATIPGRRRRVRFSGTTLSVHDRPFCPDDRSEPGHWEGDLIVGPLHRSGIGTLVAEDRPADEPITLLAAPTP